MPQQNIGCGRREGHASEVSSKQSCFDPIAKDLRKRNTEFALCSLRDPISEAFESVGFDRITQIHIVKQRRYAVTSGQRASKIEGNGM